MNKLNFIDIMASSLIEYFSKWSLRVTCLYMTDFGEDIFLTTEKPSFQYIFLLSRPIFKDDRINIGDITLFVKEWNVNQLEIFSLKQEWVEIS